MKTESVFGFDYSLLNLLLLWSGAPHWDLQSDGGALRPRLRQRQQRLRRRLQCVRGQLGLHAVVAPLPGHLIFFHKSENNVTGGLCMHAVILCKIQIDVQLQSDPTTQSQDKNVLLEERAFYDHRAVG